MRVFFDQSLTDPEEVVTSAGDEVSIKIYYTGRFLRTRSFGFIVSYIGILYNGIL